MKTRQAAPALVLCLAALAATASPARAQGFGYGFGGLAMPWVPSPTNAVNDWALQNAARGGQRPPSNNVYANNPNSYINRIRDNGFVSQQDARGRVPGSRRAAQAAARSLGQAATAAAEPAPKAAPTPAPPPAKPTLPIASFFDAAGRLVWPSDSPVDGELKAKRDVSDQATIAVRREIDAQGWAPIALAAEARQKLLDYGRPALQEIRQASTPRIAEAFHEFLMGLYDALGAATVPPPPPAPPR
ncbi:hypothetical protein [Paludisphaera mucosa]|uniref:Uncharacterized protein n=1 Tax=Paludisphaera mucosa TaxID=3030827 RepID=A0ABT6F4L5_9BACT|nr:hypothetical protein [Paludisphaera mucosa]MDG3002523.1 hypothetical protein [Paludisphaera mucosa]